MNVYLYCMYADVCIYLSMHAFSFYAIFDIIQTDVFGKLTQRAVVKVAGQSRQGAVYKQFNLSASAVGFVNSQG